MQDIKLLVRELFQKFGNLWDSWGIGTQRAQAGVQSGDTKNLLQDIVFKGERAEANSPNSYFCFLYSLCFHLVHLYSYIALGSPF